MLVRLTRRQHEIVCTDVGGRIAAILTTDLSYSGQTIVEVAAPFTAWDAGKAAMIDKYLSAKGGKLTVASTGTAFSAIRRIAKAQNAVMRHPALRRKQMLGLQRSWFPVWELPEPDLTTPGGRWYSPTPVDGCRFVVLGPLWEERARAARTTRWSPEGEWPRGHWLATESAHIL